jgi:molybdate transport system substrate-binding protein
VQRSVFAGEPESISPGNALLIPEYWDRKRLIMAGIAGGGELKVLTSVAMKGVLERLAPEFRRETGCGLSMSYGPGGIVLQRVRSGDVNDVVIATPEAVEVLIGEGRIVAGSQRPIARSVIGVAVRSGAPKPKIDTVDDFRRALLEARCVAYTNPATGAASGVHFARILDRFGIAGEINAKTKFGDGGPVAEYVARGEAELAIQQLCEHMLVTSVDIVGPLPAELQKVTIITAAVGAGASHPRHASALIDLLLAPHIQAAISTHGLEAIRS